MGILRGTADAAKFYSERLHEKDVAGKKFSQSIELLKMGWEHEREIRIEDQKIASTAAKHTAYVGATEKTLDVLTDEMESINNRLRGEAGYVMVDDTKERERLGTRLQTLRDETELMLGSYLTYGGYEEAQIKRLFPRLFNDDNTLNDHGKAVTKAAAAEIAAIKRYGKYGEVSTAEDETQGRNVGANITRLLEGSGYQFEGRRQHLDREFKEKMEKNEERAAKFTDLVLSIGKDLYKGFERKSEEVTKNETSVKIKEILFNFIFGESEETGKTNDEVFKSLQEDPEVKEKAKKQVEDEIRIIEEGITPASGIKEDWTGTRFEGMSSDEIDEMLIKESIESGGETPGGGGGAYYSQGRWIYPGEEQQGLLSQKDSFAAEYPGMHPDRPVTEAVETETILYPPAPIEGPLDPNEALAITSPIKGRPAPVPEKISSDIQQYVGKIKELADKEDVLAIIDTVKIDLPKMYMKVQDTVSKEEFLSNVNSALEDAGLGDYVPAGWAFRINTAIIGTLLKGKDWFERFVLAE
jgi:hypothetical protein|tara:strand:- start:2492 stop:4069 length:1578 start_codon:yes stop_codon:yes gene_type:complete